MVLKVISRKIYMKILRAQRHDDRRDYGSLKNSALDDCQNKNET